MLGPRIAVPPADQSRILRIGVPPWRLHCSQHTRSDACESAPRSEFLSDGGTRRCSPALRAARRRPFPETVLASFGSCARLGEVVAAQAACRAPAVQCALRRARRGACASCVPGMLPALEAGVTATNSSIGALANVRYPLRARNRALNSNLKFENEKRSPTASLHSTRSGRFGREQEFGGGGSADAPRAEPCRCHVAPHAGHGAGAMDSNPRLCCPHRRSPRVSS
jgi:hypothetical protein